MVPFIVTVCVVIATLVIMSVVIVILQRRLNKLSGDTEIPLEEIGVNGSVETSFTSTDLEGPDAGGEQPNSTRRYCLSLVKEMKSRWLNPLLNCFKRNWLRPVRGRKYHLSQVLCPAGPGRPDCKKILKFQTWNFRQFRILRILMVRAPV